MQTHVVQGTHILVQVNVPQPGGHVLSSPVQQLLGALHGREGRERGEGERGGREGRERGEEEGSVRDECQVTGCEHLGGCSWVLQVVGVVAKHSERK